MGSPDHRVGHEYTESIAQSAIGEETLISVELRLVECIWWGAMSPAFMCSSTSRHAHLVNCKQSLERRYLRGVCDIKSS